MKTLRIVITILAIGLTLSSCSLEPDFSIRVKNEYAVTVNNLMIGSVSFGSVNSGSTTAYKPVDEGTHDISGTTSSSGVLTGTVSLTGKGTHKWTITILASGGVEIEED
jgi:PBP1b-binding outer membrane lipoprotein LpoB